MKTLHHQPEVDVILPAKHIEIRLVRANETYLFGSRGSFKTTRGIALYVIDMLYEMPRSTGVLIGLSFEHLGDNTLPPLFQAFDEFGFKNGVHYVVGKRPPEHWPKPYLGVYDNKYDHVITWHNGTVLYLVSLRKKASANGVSAQWGVCDEVKFMKPEELKEVLPIFRGNEQYFQYSSGYLSKFFATDKEADPAEIAWLLKKRELHDQRKVDVIIPLQLQLNALKASYAAAGINKRLQLRGQMHSLERTLTKLRSRLVYVAEINAYDVLPILGKRWLADKKRNTSEHVFKVAFENKDPDRPGEAFYPAYEESKLCYDLDHDIDPAQPFIISADYQHTVSPIPIAQIAALPGRERASLNFVDEVYTLYPQGLRAAVRKFCERYRHHPTKEVYYVYDHTAIGKQNENDEHYKKVISELEAHDWIVYSIDTGQAPGHYQKYLDTKDWMEHKNEEELEIFISNRCVKLKKSLSGAPAKTTSGKTEKDKKFENSTKYPELDQSDTTHFSDAFDMILDAVLKQQLISVSRDAIGFEFR